VTPKAGCWGKVIFVDIKIVDRDGKVIEEIREVNEFFNDEELELLTDFPEDGRYEYVPEYGERAWKVQGRKRTLIVWDEGNGWYSLLTQITKSSVFQRPTDIELKLAGKIWGPGFYNIRKGSSGVSSQDCARHEVGKVTWKRGGDLEMDIPDVPVRIKGIHAIVEKCPFCGEPHRHGAMKGPPLRVGDSLGYRVPHCTKKPSHRCYRLIVDKIDRQRPRGRESR
jgi:hypothetical protein